MQHYKVECSRTKAVSQVFAYFKNDCPISMNLAELISTQNEALLLLYTAAIALPKCSEQPDKHANTTKQTQTQQEKSAMYTTRACVLTGENHFS